MGWFIALGVLTAIAVLPLGVSIRYGSAGAVIRALIGPVQFKVYPQKKKEPKQKKQKTSRKTPSEKPKKKAVPGPKTTKTANAGAPKEKGGPLTDFIPLVYVALDLLADLPRVFRIHRLDVNLILGGGDPADLGENYGKACAALGNLWPRLEELFVIRRRDIKVQCDFESSETRITARMDMSVTLARLFSFGFRYGFRGLREFLKITNKRKGGAAI